MFFSYLKTAARHLWKNKFYSFINVMGLTIGLICALFILYWVQDELSYDRFHENLDGLYRLEQDQNYSGDIYHVNVTPHPAGPGLAEELPEILMSCRLTGMGRVPFRYQDQIFEGRITLVDSTFFKMFSFPLLQGNPDQILKDPLTVVFTRTFAEKHFPDVNPVGQVVNVYNQLDMTVAGIVEDFPKNSSIQSEVLIPFYLLKDIGFYSDSWGNNSIITFCMTVPGVDIPALNKKITQVFKEKKDDDGSTKYMLAPLAGMHLHSHFGFGTDPGYIKYVIIFSIIGGFVLLIACINFMNLATARSVKRAREIGVRKVLGATRQKLAGQFMGEAFLTTLTALILAVVLVLVLRDGFQMLTGKEVDLSMVLKGQFLGGLILLVLITTFVSGAFPALYLSALRPVMVLKGGKGRMNTRANLRKTLVVFQFALSVFMTIGTVAVYQQIHYMQSKDLGYDKENLLYLSFGSDKADQFFELKQLLLQDSHVTGVTGTGHRPTMFGSNSGGADWPGKDPENTVLIGFNHVDLDFTDVMDIPIVAGRGFSAEYGTDIAGDSTCNFLVNEEVLKLIGREDVIGMDFDFIGYQGTIVGVMQNFHFKPVDTVIEPLAVMVRPSSMEYMVVRLAPGGLSESLAEVEKIWNRVRPEYPFSPRFIDEDLDTMYRSEKDLGILTGWFGGVALLVAGLGLFGLATFSAQQRTREMGIRKVLGASTGQLLRLMSREFFGLVVAANLLAWTPTYFLIRRWLTDYAYRIDITFIPFGLALAGSLLITFLTTTGLALKTTRTNPARILHYE